MALIASVGIGSTFLSTPAYAVTYTVTTTADAKQDQHTGAWKNASHLELKRVHPKTK